MITETIHAEPQAAKLAPLAAELQKAKTFSEKYLLLAESTDGQKALNTLEGALGPLKKEDAFIALSIGAIGQSERLLTPITSSKNPKKAWDILLAQLKSVEAFYSTLGGIIGYHATALALIQENTLRGKQHPQYLVPRSIDLTDGSTPSVRRAVATGIRALSGMAEIYPIGGAADRLSLRDENTGTYLPAARLSFCGRNLVEHLVVDLEAREYLHYKLFGKQITTPIAMMTSEEKSNRENIEAIFEENHWFGRPKESCRIFTQPLVPTMNKKGDWCFQGPQKLLSKPGGHGVLWKCAEDAGIFEWLLDLGRKHALVRQVNNLVSAVDHGLLAFAGVGIEKGSIFGFAGCPSLEGASEGVNVVVKKDEGFCLTNIEYTEFAKLDIHPEARFPTNTNVLFADLEAVRRAAKVRPIPGILINAKRMLTYRHNQSPSLDEVVRLESTMQNIADEFTSEKRDDLPTYITHNHRRKTISTVKRIASPESGFLNTPERCLLDRLENHRELLQQHCGFELPPRVDESNFFLYGPSFVFEYHPALGPLFEVIGQKLRRGRMHKGSELHLEIAELDAERLDVQGSLILTAATPLGHIDEMGRQIYSEQAGRARLKDVRIRNRGINEEIEQDFWRLPLAHKEKCEIIIESGGEFVAEGIILEGDLSIHVPSGFCVTATMKEGKLSLIKEPIKTGPSWHWNYSFGENEKIMLSHE